MEWYATIIQENDKFDNSLEYNQAAILLILAYKYNYHNHLSEARAEQGN
jgi:hypothetical protein